MVILFYYLIDTFKTKKPLIHNISHKSNQLMTTNNYIVPDKAALM